MSRRKRSLNDRFWEKVHKNGPQQNHMPTCCWTWTGARDPRGYGYIALGDGKQGYAHRVSWTLWESDPGSSFVLHKCDNPSCVRPGHLFLGTAQDNSRDASQKGRMASGGRHWMKKNPELIKRGSDLPQTKVDPEERPKIKRRIDQGERVSDLAHEYGVHRCQIWKICQMVGGV